VKNIEDGIKIGVVRNDAIVIDENTKQNIRRNN
jgi:hypothetical protein